MWINERVVFRHTHTHTHIHTYIHTHTYTHTHLAIYSIQSFTEKLFINFRVSLIQQKDIFS
jgi:hypothetical protein